MLIFRITRSKFVYQAHWIKCHTKKNMSVSQWRSQERVSLDRDVRGWSVSRWKSQERVSLDRDVRGWSVSWWRSQERVWLDRDVRGWSVSRWRSQERVSLDRDVRGWSTCNWRQLSLKMKTAAKQTCNISNSKWTSKPDARSIKKQLHNGS